MAQNTIPFPRPVREAPPPLGLYFRAGRNDHLELSNVMAAGRAAMFGVVFDPIHNKRHADLRHSVLERRLDAILDLRTQQLATPSGFTKSLSELPWASDRFHQLTDFEDIGARRLVSKIADFVVAHGYTGVFAPTHFLQDANDPWLNIDLRLTKMLRDELDKKNANSVQIIYSLVIPYSLLRNQKQRLAIKNRLIQVPMHALWLAVHSFGSDSSPTAVRNYISASRDFHDLDVPIIADRVGGLVGLSLLSFGAVGGIAHGVTLGERFDASGWFKPKENAGGFAMAPRVYVPELDLFLKRSEASVLFAVQRAKSRFGCRDTKCCPGGVKDMLDKPSRHFIVRRMTEIGDLSRIPDPLRAQRFLEQNLRPATDAAVFAEQLNLPDDAIAKKMRSKRKRLENLRIALGDFAQHDSSPTFAELPKTRVARGMN